jgi:hypothetical protein
VEHGSSDFRDDEENTPERISYAAANERGDARRKMRVGPDVTAVTHVAE